VSQGTTTPRLLEGQANMALVQRIRWRPAVRAYLSMVLVLNGLISVQAIAAAYDESFNLNIPSAKADIALKNLARQTGCSVIFRSADIENIEVGPLNGRFTVQQAIDELLKKTVLVSSFTQRTVITVAQPEHYKNISPGMESKKNILEKIVAFLFPTRRAQGRSAIGVGSESSLLADSARLPIEELIVTGIRETLKQNMDIKRNSNALVDAITAVDVGRFPDKNVADALQRIPGVSITRAGGEGQYVSIRGTSADLTLTLLNGNYIATASTSSEPSRSFNYSLLPANLIESIKVYKTPQAKFDEGGLGGTVIVNTRRPLSMESGSGFLDVESSYADVTEQVEPQYSGLYSWKNNRETLGVLLSYTSQKRTNIVEGISIENWTLFDDARADESFAQASLRDSDGNEITGYAPFAVVQSRFKEDRDRKGYQMTVQWQPSERLMTTFNYIGAKLEQNGDDNLVILAEWDYRDPAIVPGSVRYRGNTIVAMDMSDSDLTDHSVDLQSPAIGTRRTRSTSKSDTYDLDLFYQGNDHSASMNLGHTRSTGGTTFNNLQRFYGLGGVTQSFGWDLTADTIVHYDADTSDFNQFGWRSMDAGLSKDEETYIQIDYTLYHPVGIFTSFDIGTKYRNHNIERRAINMGWDDDDPNNATIWGGCCDLGFEFWHTDSNLPSADEIASFVSVIDGLTGEAGTQTSFLSVDWDAYISWLDKNFNRTRYNEKDRYFKIKEQVSAAYLQGNYEIGSISGNVGLRAFKTDQLTQAYGASTSDIAGQLITHNANYTDVLPSFNLKWSVTENLVFRAAAAQVIARVAYNDLGEPEEYSDAPAGSDTTTGKRGNADLEPFKSTQYDLGVAWYFMPVSVMGATLFHKQIDSFVTNAKTTGERTTPSRDEPITVEFSIPVNGSDATSTGLELFYQQAFEFGGGIIANYTYTDTSLATVNNTDGSTDEIPLPGTSKHQYNFSTYYETDRYSVRASYNYRGDYAESEISNGQTVFRKSYGQVDMNASFYFTDALSVSASVINLTKETSGRYWGNEDRLYGRTYSGRRFYAGLNYRF
jgi:iron complex outermembrane recepter protein